MKSNEGQDFVNEETAAAGRTEAIETRKSGMQHREGPRAPLGGARFWALALALLALNSLGLYWIGRDVRAASPDSVRVSQVLPVRNIDRASELTLVFDRPMVSPDVIGITLRDSPIELKPALEGRWTWSGVAELSFELKAPVPPGRRLRLSAAPDFEALVGRRLVGETSFELHGEPLELTRLRVESADPQAATLSFGFNQPVEPAALRAALTIRVGDRAIEELEVIGRGVASELLVRLPRTRLPRTRMPSNDDLFVELAAGLRSPGADLGLERAVTRSFDLPSHFVTLGARAYPSRDENACTVRLRFSEALALGQELAPLAFTPEVADYSAHVSGRALVVEGNFECGRRYEVAIGASLLSADGETLGTSSVLSFLVPERANQLSLPDGDGLLSPGGRLELALRATNVANLELGVARLHANNLVEHLHGGGTRQTSRRLAARRIALDLEPNRVSECVLSLRDSLDDPLGVYEVSVRDLDDRWERDSSIVRISDLALTVKRERGGYFVWVTSLSSAAPLAGVALEARSYDNQPLAGALTGADGGAHLELPEGAAQAFVITASLGRDFAYLRPDRRSWVFDSLDTSGRAYADELDVWLYSDRGAYRPGETIHLSGVLRTAGGGFAPGARRELLLRRPDGRVDWSAELVGEAAVDTQGLFQLDVPTRLQGRTGVHELVLRELDSRAELASLEVLVEDFLPSRLEVEAATVVLAASAEPPSRELPPTTPPTAGSAAIEASAGLTGPGAPSAAPVAATHLPRRIGLDFDAHDFLGHAAADLPLRVTPSWRRISFESSSFPEFHFDELEGRSSVSLRRGEHRAELDEEGHARVELVPPGDRARGVWELSAAATVTAIGGRSTSRNLRARLDNAARHLGFRLVEGPVAPPGRDFAVAWQWVTPGDAAAEPIEAVLRLEHVVREYGLVHERNELVWRRKERVFDLGRYPLAGTSSGTLELRVPAKGLYRLVAEDLGQGAPARFEFRAGGTSAPAEQHPEDLVLTLDRHAYTPGERIEVEVNGEFDGRLLVTLESDSVLASRVLEFRTPSARVEFELPADLRGGAFVSASLIRAVDPEQTSWMPHRARGLARVRSDHADHVLPLELDAPTRVRPGERILVRVRGDAPRSAARPARLHLWAVDAGILQATAEAAPDPHAHFFAQHRAAVRTSDDWAELLPDHVTPESVRRIGGDRDSEEALARRLSALPAAEREAGVAWARALDLGPDGTAEVELVMPELRGAVELRAVLIDGDHYGAAERRVELATELHLVASWPRFCAPGDRLRVPVRLRNTTERPLAFDLELSIEGPLSVEADEAPRELELAPGAERTLWYEVRALDLGPVAVDLIARGDGLEEHARASFAVRPAIPLHQESSLTLIEPGTRRAFDPGAGFRARGLRVRVETSANGDVELRPALEALLAYPHGCVEQTTSRLFALVHAGRLVGPIAEGEDGSPLVRSMVRAGIDRLQAMQTASGGLGYWIGDRNANPWGSAYAASFLVEARREGYELRADFTEPLLDYLSTRLSEGQGELDTSALLCRVLAAFGRPHEGWMTRLLERRGELDMAGRAQLASAWLELGRRDRALECLGQDTLELVARTSSSGRLTSQVRQQGALLSTLLDLDPSHPWVGLVATRLNEARENGRWRSTLEDAAALAALARYQELGESRGDFRGALLTADGERHEFDSSARAVFELRGEAASGPFTIEVEGLGAAHVLIDAEGLPIAEVAAYDRGLVVRRRLLDSRGELIDALEVEVGDLLLVEVELSAPGLGRSEGIDNVAVVDTLPAGLEVENPRLADAVHVPGFEAGNADRVEFRDDRVVLFATARKRPAVFRYTLRARAEGVFSLPPIQASSMYDPGCASLGEFGTLRIVAPKER